MLEKEIDKRVKSIQIHKVLLFQKLQRTSLESTLPNDLTVGGSKAVLSSLMTFFPLTELSDNPNVLQHRMGDFVTKKQSVQVNIVTVVTLISLNACL